MKLTTPCFFLALATGALAACSDGSEASEQAEDLGSPDANGSSQDEPDPNGTADPVEDFDPTEEDFDCITEWEQVRSFRITNKAGLLEETLEVARDPEGKRYPVGTMIQLVPIEAMVKRGPGFSEETNDWEFFFLNVSGGETVIEARGTTDVVNQFGGNCFDCHRQADPRFDFVCEQDNGCVSLPLPPSTIQSLQNSDPRCP